MLALRFGNPWAFIDDVQEGPLGSGIDAGFEAYPGAAGLLFAVALLIVSSIRSPAPSGAGMR